MRPRLPPRPPSPASGGRVGCGQFVMKPGETIPGRRFGPFDERAIATYAAASGDDNPLHVDPAIAAKAGLAKPPIHGMLMMGCFQAFLEDWRPGIAVRKLNAKFIRPVLVGGAIDVAGKVVQAGGNGSAVLRLMVKDEAGTLVCLAEAFVDP